MITTISKELEDSPTNKEEENHHTRDRLKINNASSSSSQSPWLRLKDPRIVRVSRAFGGKDRHSKVCTIKGLRDRRVRLSVPTAIQLYNLQDRLGLNQPSKVVDWLLNVAKHEIDELPPLPISPINFTLNHLANFSPQSNKQGFKMNNLEDEDFSNETLLRAKSKQVSRDDQKENWIKRTENDDEQEGNEGQHLVHSSESGLMNNNNTLVVPYGTSFFQLDHHSNFGGGFGSRNADHHDLHNLNAMPLHPSALSLSSSSSGSHVFVPHLSYFPAAHLASSDDHNADPRQMNNFQMFSSSSTQNLFPNSFTQNPYNSMNQSSGSVRGFNFNIAPRLFNTSSEAADNKDQDLE